MRAYTLTPRDVLFFRDARPFETGGGHGAVWPSPSTLFGALHAALHRAWPKEMPVEHRHRLRVGDIEDDAQRHRRFGSLVTAGPFPVRIAAGSSGAQATWYLPCPADLATLGDRVGFAPARIAGSSDLPRPLSLAVCPLGHPSKEVPPAWLDAAGFQAYLRGDRVPKSSHATNADIFAAEWTTGIGISPETQTQDGERIYSAEYLRLKDGVAMGLLASMPLKERNGEEGLDQLLADGHLLVCGGQQRVCNVQRLSDAALRTALPRSAPVTGNRLKWVLLSPAVFPAIAPHDRTAAEGGPIRAHPGGWLPNWIEPDTGSVLLKKGDTTRSPRESRERWRQRVRELPGFDCRLVAAQVPKAIVVSGWSDAIRLQTVLTAGSDKPTTLAVPAGAVYYFEGADAAELAMTLAWHGDAGDGTVINRRSTLFGEQGFGLGVCGSWSPAEGGAPA